MKHVHLTWYVLVDGTNADPDDVAPGEDGILRHKSGMPVAQRESGAPMTVGVTAEENMNVEAAQTRISDAPAPPAAPEPEPEAGEVVTEIDPAAGQPAVETSAQEPPPPPAKPVAAAKPKKVGKGRDMKAGASKTYETR